MKESETAIEHDDPCRRKAIHRSDPRNAFTVRLFGQTVPDLAVEKRNSQEIFEQRYDDPVALTIFDLLIKMSNVRKFLVYANCSNGECRSIISDSKERDIFMDRNEGRGDSR